MPRTFLTPLFAAVVSLAVLPANGAVRTRVWKSDVRDDGAIHCLGNGRLIAFEQGPNITQLFGPPYSTPSAAAFSLDPSEALEARSSREPGAAIWTHRVFAGGGQAAEMLDFVDSRLPVFVRRIETEAPLRFRLRPAPDTRVVVNGARYRGAAGGFLIESPAGKFIYQTYPLRTPVFHQVVWTGAVEANRDSDGSTVTCRGECVFYWVGGPSYPEAVAHTEETLKTGVAPLLERTRAEWRRFSAGRTDFAPILPRDIPHRELLLETIDDVAVLIKVQQAKEGAVLAGYPYHLGYVFDQYGVARGLLELGLVREARQNLIFYWDVWKKHGVLHQAQGIGVDGLFHIHENDDVSNTGILILQAFDYAERSGDRALLQTIFPMLEWAWEAQKRHLVDGMLPFNGDETYVAGGMLPRTTLNDGSSEGTLLFIEGGQKLLRWAEEHKAWPPAKAAANRTVLESAVRTYRPNFWRAGCLIANNPSRLLPAAMPRFRHGVCERCKDEKRFRGLIWTERSSTGRYLCPDCLAKDPYPAVAPRAYDLLSIGLTPIYYRSSLIAAGELRTSAEAIARDFLGTGRFASRADAGAADRAVGYDYGLLLFALTELDHPSAKAVYEKSLLLADSTGAWAEYYLNNAPQGCRCRPWESAINLEAILRWARRSSSQR